ncbi:unnamed protein product, partial [Ectocarpus sp. 6 AP-2014]
SIQLPDHFGGPVQVVPGLRDADQGLAGVDKGSTRYCDGEHKTPRTSSGELAGHLNDLVEASARDADNQVANVVFVKTHKTGSTTLAAVFYRYAVRHELKLAHFGRGKGTIANLKKAATQTRKSGERVDVMHYHISHSGEYTGTWPQAENYFRRIMRHPDSINFVTVLREPRSHLLSCYYFYIFPECELSIEDYLMDPAHAGDENRHRLRNPLSAEFGVKTTKEMNTFIENHLPDFTLVMLTERMDESLMILRSLLGWHMIDVTYASLNATRAGARRYDGKP